MRVLLVATNTMLQPYPVYPIGLDYVRNAICTNHDVRNVDMNQLKDLSALAAILTDFAPDVIGLSIRNIDNTDQVHTESFFAPIRTLIETIRRHSRGLVVLGGSAFTILPAEFMAGLDADYGLIGEGERFPILLQALEKGQPVSGLPGVVAGRGPAVFPEPLTESFNRGELPDHSYRSFYLERGGMLNLQTKRGCPFACVYCTYPHIEGRRFRFEAPEEVARTARMLQDAGARYLYLTDSTFNGSYDHSQAVALAFKKTGVTIPWGGFFTPTAAPPDYYRILADCGLQHAEFGTEVLSDPVLKAYGKPFRVEDVWNSHRAALEAGLHVAHYFMLGGPGETEQTVEETLLKAAALEKSAFFAFCGIRIYPHTPLYERALREGQIAADVNLLEPVFYFSPAINRQILSDRLTAHAAGNSNWIVGSGPPGIYKMMAKLYARGHVGPLWEHLIR